MAKESGKNGNEPLLPVYPERYASGQCRYANGIHGRNTGRCLKSTKHAAEKLKTECFEITKSQESLITEKWNQKL
jgi:hypothetical protein